MRDRTTTLLVTMLALVGLVTSGCGIADLGGDGGDSGPEQPTYSYVIPAGSQDRIESGEKLEILPAVLEVELNDTIQIVNEDDSPHFLGPWFLGPREVLRQRFATVGVFEGECSVHPSGEFKVIVDA